VVTLREAAHDWMEKHPVTMGLYRRFAMEKLARNSRFSLRQLTERIRWEYDTDARLTDKFKINDKFTPYIGRKLVEETPELADLIECRVLRSADLPFNNSDPDDRVDPRKGWLL
jgi:hypothetical protein